MIGKPLLAGRRAYEPSPLDVPHSWTSIHDCARTLVTAAANELAYGQAWLVPTNPPLTVRQLAARFAEVNGAPRAKVTQIPYPVMWVSGLFSPLIKELRTTRYQFTRPFVLDATATTDMFGLQPIAMDEALRMLLPGSVLDAGRRRQSGPGLNGFGTGYRSASGRGVPEPAGDCARLSAGYPA